MTIQEENRNVLELFAGAGGGILASQINGHRTVCAVEIEPYCRCVLLRRQNEGKLPPFPIWDDIRTFDGKLWQGIVDIVSGGFPCQNISAAGKGEGITGEKSSLWFEMLRIIREVRPKFAFVENSDRLVRRGLDVVLQGLAESGFDAEWLVLGANDVGAPHIRKRCWILGRNVDDKRHETIPTVCRGENAESERICTNVSDTDIDHKRFGRRKSQPGNGHQTRNVPDVDLSGREKQRWTVADGTQSEAAQCVGWWQAEPGVVRVVHGFPGRVDRIKALGNAQVPLCAATAFQILFERFNEHE